MAFRVHILFVILFLAGSGRYAEGQETSYFPGYQTIISLNPGYTGCGDDGALRVSYHNFLPGNHYDFHTGYISYDSYFDAIHGGAGFYISNDYLGGILNDLRGGISYSYYLRAGKEIYINAGLSASFYHRGYNFSDAVFPDQIDIMGNISLPSSEDITNENKTVLDIGTGFVVTYRQITGGLSVSHLTRPGLGISDSEIERLNRKYSMNLMLNIPLNIEQDLLLRPVISTEIQGDFITAATGAILSNNSLGSNLLFIYNNAGNLDIQAGFSLRKERLSLFYNYRFNISSHNTFMPFSLMHQTGIILSLNKVEKRIKNRTINLPVM
jgi:type IX secretion system PorP/SprF family membrane protein